MTAVTQILATLAASPVPASARTRAAEALSEVTAAAAQGASAPAVTALSAVAASLSTPPEAPVPGTTARYSAAWSAYLTATAAASAAPADHATTVVPTALAVAAEQGPRPDDVAAAAAAGLEVARRLDGVFADALGAFDRVATIGRLAAVAAAGRLLGLSAGRQAEAYGIAGTQAAGFAAVTGPAGALQIGKAAFDAVEAAYLARAGYTAGPAGIEGRRGFAALLAPAADLTALAEYT